MISNGIDFLSFENDFSEKWNTFDDLRCNILKSCLSNQKGGITYYFLPSWSQQYVFLKIGSSQCETLEKKEKSKLSCIAHSTLVQLEIIIYGQMINDWTK